MPRSCVESPSTSPERIRKKTKCELFSPIRHQTSVKSSSIGCWPAKLTLTTLPISGILSCETKNGRLRTLMGPTPSTVGSGTAFTRTSRMISSYGKSFRLPAKRPQIQLLSGTGKSTRSMSRLRIPLSCSSVFGFSVPAVTTTRSRSGARMTTTASLHSSQQLAIRRCLVH